ncbi:NAD(P)-dependent alcohol dehydrogenase [Persicitalea sp.]|uniref:NAD(P)-dependent alcohol dehydrogenase n=1 Tax=Persicitalea sp. TaxID=3100273 RepID=UPI0035947834
MKTTFRKNYSSTDALEIREAPIPQPQENEVLVKVKATTVNRTDEGVLLGKPFIFRFFVGFPKPRLSTTGTDFSGVVVDKGSDVSNFKIGDEVYGFLDTGLGTHAEYVCVAADKPIFRKPDTISHEAAAASLEGAHYAYFFLERVKIKPGDRVLVNGATGAIGNAAIQLLLHRGAKVTFTYPTDSYEKVKYLPAERMIDYLKEDFTEQSELFDFVFDAVGKSSFGACKHLLKPGGIYISSELGPNGENIPLSIMGLFKKGKRVVFPFPGSPKVSIPAIRELIEQGQYAPLIDRVYALDDIGEAFDYMLTGQKRGNVVVTTNF